VALSETEKSAILHFVDQIVPEGGTEVWLTGSRAKGTARPDSDWDVMVFTPYGPTAEKVFHVGTQESAVYIEGGPIRLATAHPNFWDDPGQYMTDLKLFGVRLR
jgi:predicted nucleotidyltransferase